MKKKKSTPPVQLERFPLILTHWLSQDKPSWIAVDKAQHLSRLVLKPTDNTPPKKKRKQKKKTHVNINKTKKKEERTTEEVFELMN